MNQSCLSSRGCSGQTRLVASHPSVSGGNQLSTLVEGGEGAGLERGGEGCWGGESSWVGCSCGVAGLHDSEEWPSTAASHPAAHRHQVWAIIVGCCRHILRWPPLWLKLLLSMYSAMAAAPCVHVVMCGRCPAAPPAHWPSILQPWCSGGASRLAVVTGAPYKVLLVPGNMSMIGTSIPCMALRILDIAAWALAGCPRGGLVVRPV